MAVIRGSFAENTPLVSITVRAGIASISITAVIDTGFAGFAAAPVGVVEALGLPRRGLAEVEYADGSRDILALAAAHIELGEQSQGGLVYVTSGEALIGIDLLRAFRKIFVLSGSAGSVLLVDSLAEAI